MPHAREAVPASHDRHDTLLVAALAAGDLARADRDQALTLTASCTNCAALHADLVAIARATAALPPPIASSGRDFRLTPDQAAKLRRTGWRRFLPTAGSVPFSRPLGAALATLGIAGLLIGTQPLGFAGSSASSVPSPAPAALERLNDAAAPEADGQSLGAVAAASAAAASAGAAVPAAASAAASMAAGSEGFGTAASAAPSVVSYPDRASAGPARGAVGGGTIAGVPETPGSSAGDQNGGASGASAETKGGLFGTGSPSTSTSPSPLVLISLAAFAIGVVLIVASYRGRRTSL